MTDEITREMFQHSTVVIAGLNDHIEALTAENERLREVLEQFLALIKHQYFGSREAMNALQEADNAARAALGERE